MINVSRMFENLSLGRVASTSCNRSPQPKKLIKRMHSSRMPTVRCSGCLSCHAHALLWTEFLTHTCEDITFPQLLLRTVIIIIKESTVGHQGGYARRFKNNTSITSCWQNDWRCLDLNYSELLSSGGSRISQTMIGGGANIFGIWPKRNKLGRRGGVGSAPMHLLNPLMRLYAWKLTFIVVKYANCW